MISMFINRPVLSIVISILIVLLGALALTQLPMAQFPGIAPPEVNVTIEYTGANAETVTKAAIMPLEKAINGVPRMKYMSSDAGNDGVGVVQIIFEIGTDPDVAAVNVQNRVGTVMGELPPEVTKNGVKIAKEENAMLMYINVFSKDDALQEKFLYNFVDINILPELKRINGIGYAELLGAKKYAMRIWLKPDKMIAYNLSADEIIATLQKQNVEAAPGKVGESSDKTSQSLQYVIRYSGKYSTKEEYENIPVKATEAGEILRMKDIAIVEFGTTYFDVESRLNGRPSAAIMIKQLPGSNASEVIKTIKERIAQIKDESFLTGMDYEISYDVSRFLDASVDEVLKTLVEAFLLVSLVVFVFLQDWRSTIIPAIAVPVSLIGTLFFMQLFGFSLNLITLFSLVLAIGIVVDDAIVVVEAVHAKMDQKHISAKEAAIEAMKEISGAIVAITLVMSAVFVPVAFMSGPSGIFYKQFSLTMATSIILSGVVALTLTPSLCALILKEHSSNQTRQSWLARFFNSFNSWYSSLSGRYLAVLHVIVNRKVIIFCTLIAFCAGIGIIGKTLPAGFIPNEDQGTFYASVTTPPGSTLERTKAVVNEIQSSCEAIEAISSVSSLAGTNILSDGTGATYGTCIVNLKNWDERHESLREVMDLLEQKTNHIKDARIEFFPPPAVPGYGNASGFELRLLDKTGSGDLQKMQAVSSDFIKELKHRPEIGSAFTSFDASFPQYTLHVDPDKAAQKGISIEETMLTLQTLLGSEYASNFIRFGQLYRVMVQALPEYRAKPEDILKLTVKNDKDEMVSLSSFVTLEKTFGVDQITRYNMYTSAEMNGEQTPGYSSGSAIKAIQETAEEKLPSGYAIDWAGISRDEVLTGNESVYVFLICIVFVYFLLAAQYESFLLPMPVILSLPTGIFGVFFILKLAGLENNIYAQIAVIMLIGLLAKNAILIIEFAILKQKEGKTAVDAALEGARLRLRPILMTSFAFVAGLMPLMFASGAGAVGNRTIGTAAAGGMVFGTIFGLILIPGLYVVFAALGEKLFSKKAVTTGIIILFGSVAIIGCKSPAVTQDEQGRKIPESFTALKDSVNSQSVKWREYFKDQHLLTLIDSTLKNNFDAAIAFQRIEMARAQVRYTKGLSLPIVNAAAIPKINRYGLYTMDGAGNITTDITPGQIVPINLPDYFVGIQASWETDIWGKLRNKKKAALARYLSSVEGRRWLTTSLVAEVAISYYELLALDTELEILHETIELQKNALTIVEAQKDAGAANKLAVEQFQAQLLNSQSLEVDVQQRIVEQQSVINVLRGSYPVKIVRDQDRFYEVNPPDVNTGLPADLLRNRADIRQAELELVAAKADVRAAKAAFYPSFVITGGAGFQAFNTRYLFHSPESFVFGLAGNLAAPLINRSAIKAEFSTANAMQLEALYNYQRIILKAYVEVYNGVNRLDNLNKVYLFKNEEVNVRSQSVQTSSDLFKTGRATYLEVLLAQQNALTSKLDFVNVRRDQFLSTITVYRALGGGWD